MSTADSLRQRHSYWQIGAGKGIRTPEGLRVRVGPTPQDYFSGHVRFFDLKFNTAHLGGPAPLTWLGNPRIELKEWDVQ